MSTKLAATLSASTAPELRTVVTAPLTTARPPCERYEPATVQGSFVGWYSPEEVALSKTDFPAAFEHFVYSDRYNSSWVNAMFILEREMGRPRPGYGG
ncbi:MAG: hypothetical protein C0464_00335 [Cyanobacteria bacterium DS2.008]|nr:hypothetical protein [Cyanobacteria bacterium DS2.008]